MHLENFATPGRPLVDSTKLESARDGFVVNAAHWLYEHLISLWATAVIEAAADLRVFETLIESPMTIPDLAKHLDTDARATRVLLDGLFAYDVLERHFNAAGEAVYSLSDELAACLNPGGLYSMTGKIRYDRHVAWNAWRNLASAVRGGRGSTPGFERLNLMPAADYEALVQGINFWAPPIVETLVRALGWPNGKHARVLDVGCGTGLYSHLLLERYEGLRAVGYDVPGMVKLSSEQAERLGVADRFTAHSADFLTDSWGVGFDLVLCVNISHLLPPEAAQVLVAKAASALAPGGVFAIVDHIVEADRPAARPQDRFSLLFAVSMLATGGGDAFVVGDYDDWLAAAGLRRLQLLDAPMHRILLAGSA